MIIAYLIIGSMLAMAVIALYNAYEGHKYRKNEIGRIVGGKCSLCPYEQRCWIACQPVGRKHGTL